MVLDFSKTDNDRYAIGKSKPKLMITLYSQTCSKMLNVKQFNNQLNEIQMLLSKYCHFAKKYLHIHVQALTTSKYKIFLAM